MTENQTKALREQLLHALRGDQSHLDFESAIADFPVGQAAMKPQGAPHSAWQLLEHMRIAQNDILEFSRNPKHTSPKWPDEYWPASDAPSSPEQWQMSVAQFQQDSRAMEDLISRAEDLFAPIPGAGGQTLLREALVLANHNSYHLGQLVYLKKIIQQIS